MKTTLTIIVCLFSFAAFSQKLKFDETKHNFGYIQKGDIDTIHYKFVNAGDAPLIITDAKVECSCTKVLFPRSPVSPGEGGVVTVVFDSKSAIGLQDRVVTLVSNSKKGQDKIHFKGEVIQRQKMGF